jgi:hypothetical protein
MKYSYFGSPVYYFHCIQCVSVCLNYYLLSVDITGSAFGLNAENIPHLVDGGTITNVYQGPVSSSSTVSMFQLCHNLGL